MYIGGEALRAGGHDIAVTVDDFWRWNFSDLSVPATRAAFVKFLVASSLGLISDPPKHMGRDCDLIWTPSSSTGICIGVKEAFYAPLDNAACPEYIVFALPLKADCDVHIFCVFHPQAWTEHLSGTAFSPLDLDLWDFYVFPSAGMGRRNPGLGFLALPALVSLESAWSDYYGIAGAVKRAMAS